MPFRYKISECSCIGDEIDTYTCFGNEHSLRLLVKMSSRKFTLLMHRSIRSEHILGRLPRVILDHEDPMNHRSTWDETLGDD
jgi:hypothetical protein